VRVLQLLFGNGVLAIHAREGEVAPSGLLDLGRTDTMEVLAEVYESDIRRVSPGQRVEVRGDAFESAVTGRVVEIGRQVRPNRLLNPDPAAFADNRVVEVTVELEDASRLASLSGALVRVHFRP
jgi:HlyD family secretion protein